MKKYKIPLIIYSLFCLSLSLSHTAIADSEIEERTFLKRTIRVTEIVVSGAYGTHVGGDIVHAPLEDIEKHGATQKLLSDQEKLDELEKQAKTLRDKLEKDAEEEESDWWKTTKQTFIAVKETVGIVGVVLGIVVAIIALL